MGAQSPGPHPNFGRPCSALGRRSNTEAARAPLLFRAFCCCPPLVLITILAAAANLLLSRS